MFRVKVRLRVSARVRFRVWVRVRVIRFIQVKLGSRSVHVGPRNGDNLTTLFCKNNGLNQIDFRCNSRVLMDRLSVQYPRHKYIIICASLTLMSVCIILLVIVIA